MNVSKKVIALHVAISAALQSRADVAIAASNATQQAFFINQVKLFSVAHVNALHAVNIDCNALAVMLSNADKKKSSANTFVAKYAVDKIRKIAQALSQNSLLQCDDYTQSILLNSRKLESLSAKSALVCLSRAIEYVETDNVQAIKRYKNCVASTASTQRSSTREALRVLNIASVTKNARDDAIVFADSDAARAMQALCDAALTK